MTTITSLRSSASPRMPEVFQFSPECEELDGLLSWWMNGGAGHSDAWREVYNHLHTCPVCVERAARLPKVTAHIPTSWLSGVEL